MNTVRLAIATGVLITSGGCFMQKKPVVKVPVTTPPAPMTAPVPVPEEKPAVIAQPTLDPNPATVPPPPPANIPKPSPFPPAATVPTRPSRPAPVTPAPITPPTPAPALGAMLSADKRKELDAAYQSDLGQANALLGKLSGRGLTSQQVESVNRARDFIRQAGQYHDRDLATAAELARRARVLTQDLAADLK